jgi:hypothetical protein
VARQADPAWFPAGSPAELTVRLLATLASPRRGRGDLAVGCSRNSRSRPPMMFHIGAFVSRRFNFRTGCERNAPESLTDGKSRSVPPDMVIFRRFNATICFWSPQGAFSIPRIEGLRLAFLSIASRAR